MANRHANPAHSKSFDEVRRSWNRIAAIVSVVAIALHLLLRYLLHRSGPAASAPLWIAVAAGGLPLLYDLAVQIWKRQFGADFLAGLSIVTAALMQEWLVATIIVLMSPAASR